MSQIVECVCPLCQSEAKCEEHMMRRLRHFLCPVCKDFVIKSKAEAYLAGSIEQTRLHFSVGCANAPPGLVPLVHFEPNGPGTSPTVTIDYLEIQDALHR